MSNAFEIWVYDQLNPEERLFARPVPGYAVPFPSHLIKNAPEEITDLQREEREDDFLRKNGVK